MSISINAPAPFVMPRGKKEGAGGGANTPKAPKLKQAGPTLAAALDVIGEIKERMAGRLALA